MPFCDHIRMITHPHFLAQLFSIKTVAFELSLSPSTSGFHPSNEIILRLPVVENIGNTPYPDIWSGCRGTCRRQSSQYGRMILSCGALIGPCVRMASSYGAILPPCGGVISSCDAMILTYGKGVLPCGAILLPCVEMDLTCVAKRLPCGRMILTYGKGILPSGAIVLPCGEMILPYAELAWP